MSDMNVVCLNGRIAKDAELKVKGQTTVCEFTLAVNRDRKDKDSGEYTSIPNFIHLALFDDYGRKMAQHLYKGRTVSVVGELRVDTWVKDNKTYERLGVAVHRIGLAFPLPLRGDVHGAEYGGKPADGEPQGEPPIPFEEEDFDIV